MNHLSRTVCWNTKQIKIIFEIKPSVFTGILCPKFCLVQTWIWMHQECECPWQTASANLYTLQLSCAFLASFKGRQTVHCSTLTSELEERSAMGGVMTPIFSFRTGNELPSPLAVLVRQTTWKEPANFHLPERLTPEVEALRRRSFCQSISNIHTALWKGKALHLNSGVKLCEEGGG